MTLHLPTLLVASSVLVLLASGAMALFGLKQRVFRGHLAWVLAQKMVLAGLILHAWPVSGPVQLVLADLLLLQWPITTLIGLRHFNARSVLRGSTATDLLALGVAGASLAVLATLGEAAHLPAFAGAMAGLYGHAAYALVATPATRESRGAMALAGGLLATAGAAVGTLAWSLLATPEPAGAGLHAPALMVVPLALLMAWLALLLTHERIERELRESQRRLRFLANIDMLTRVPNRRHFSELAQRTLRDEPAGSAAVLMFDIDHFKNINDLLGHAAGDRALRVVSRCVQDTLRSHDVAGRHGGDEFALLLPRTSPSDAIAVAGRIVSLAQTMAEEQAIPNLSLSFGVVQMRPGETLDEALRRADGALYEAKRQGRGRAVSAVGDEEAPVFTESRRLGLTSL